MKKTLTAIAAAAGIMSCGNNVPIYSQRDVFLQEGDKLGYTELRSDGEQLRMSVVGEIAGVKNEEISFTRVENSRTDECLREEFYSLTSDGYVRLVDEGCNRDVDTVYLELYGESGTITRDQFANRLDGLYWAGYLNVNRYFHIPKQIKAWHERKEQSRQEQ